MRTIFSSLSQQKFLAGMRSLPLFLFGFLLVAGFLSGSAVLRSAAAGKVSAFVFADNPFPVTTVSGITFESTSIAPQSIVSGFGTLLATTTAGATTVPLLTELGGTIIEVNGVRAPILSVAPTQVNYLIPAGTAAGTANVVVTSSDGTVSRGTVQVRNIAPVIATANPGGTGVPDGQAIRVRPDNSQSMESLAQLNAATGQFITRPLNLGPPSEKVIAVLFLSGTRNVPDTDGNAGNGSAENVRVILGGLEIIPAFLGVSPTLAGLEQLNFEIPRNLIGSGLVTLAVTGAGFGSNLTELEIAAPSTNTLAITSFSPSANLLAGETLTLNGTFASNPAANTVRVSGLEAPITAAMPGQLSVTIPFGAQSGQVSVTTPDGQTASTSAISMRTSVSGFVENTDGQPLGSCTIRQLNPPRSAISNTDGSFVLPDTSAGAIVVEVDGTTIPANPSWPKVTLKKLVSSDRDNPFSHPIPLQQNTGETIPVGFPGGDASNRMESGIEVQPVPVSNFMALWKLPWWHSLAWGRLPRLLHYLAVFHSHFQTPNFIEGRDGGITFSVPRNARVSFPDGRTRGDVIVTKIFNSRTPTPLPPNVFSSSIVQLVPFGVNIFPGAKLTFPNSDNLPAGSTVLIYQLDQRPFSFVSSVGDSSSGNGNDGLLLRQLLQGPINPTLGEFTAMGTATVSRDGTTVETAADAIKQTGIYFAAAPRPDTTTIAGRVFDCQCDTSARIEVRANGQETFADGNNGFVLRYVPVANAVTVIPIQVTLLRNNQVVETLSASLSPVPGGLTLVKNDFVFNQQKCPVAYNQLVWTMKGTPLSFRLDVRGMGGQSSSKLRPPYANEADLEYIIIRGPVYGTVKLGLNFFYAPKVGPNVTYTPRLNFAGVDSFIYKVSNGCQESAPVLVKIMVKPSFSSSDRP